MNKMMESVKAILSTTPVRWLKLAKPSPGDPFPTPAPSNGLPWSVYST